MSCNLQAHEKECGNCKHLSDTTTISDKGLNGRAHGECQMGQGERYVTDYCWRWELTNGHVQIAGRRGDTGCKSTGHNAGAVGDSRPTPSY